MIISLVDRLADRPATTGPRGLDALAVEAALNGRRPYHAFSPTEFRTSVGAVTS